MMQLKDAKTAQDHFCDGAYKPEMVVIAPGSFEMGASDDADKFSSIIEKPRHLVQFARPFAVGRFPVTFEEWDAYAQSDPSAHRPDDRGWGRGHLPVVNVSWEDAQLYVSWLSERTDRAYRLLSESEWEYCCRAGTSGVFGSNGSISIKDANFLYLDFGDKPGVGRPVPVGSYPANAFGLQDVFGNVCELVEDAWHDNYRNAPDDGSAWEDLEPSMWRVVRGGGWDAMPRILRAAFRDWIHHTQRLDNTGFRVACSL